MINPYETSGQALELRHRRRSVRRYIALAMLFISLSLVFVLPAFFLLNQSWKINGSLTSVSGFEINDQPVSTETVMAYLFGGSAIMAGLSLIPIVIAIKNARKNRIQSDSDLSVVSQAQEFEQLG